MEEIKKSKYTVDDFIVEMDSAEMMFEELNTFFGLTEDGKMDEFLLWYFGE